MATATVVKESKTRVVVEEEVSGYVLKLSKKEAETLWLVARCVGGSPELSRRGDMDNIYRALHEVGVCIIDTSSPSGGVYFDSDN